MCIKLCVCIRYQAAWIVDYTDVEDSGRSDNGVVDDRMVPVHMASFGNNSELTLGEYEGFRFSYGTMKDNSDGYIGGVWNVTNVSGAPC